jgi:gliding motility-associated-like protein
LPDNQPVPVVFIKMKLPANLKYSCIAIIGATLFNLFFNFRSQAQSLGDPIVNITFGSGTATHAGALAADSGSTSYTYTSADFPNDGSYTIERTTNTPGTWWTTTDHTGNTNGYMMVVNASVSKTDYFYKRQVTGLCGATTYQFSAWVGNLLKSQDNSPPNITFSILNTDGSLIQSYNTGAIALNTSGFKWVQETFQFTLPAGTTSVIIQMTNNSNGGAPANDLALDDITFRPYGSPIAAVFSNTSTAQTTCAGTSQTVTVSSTTTLAAGYVQKLQLLVNNTWTDLSAASTNTTFTATSPTTAGTYYYRLVTALADNVSSAQCVVGSNQLSLTVEAAPTATFSVADTICLGSPTVFTDNTTTGGGTIVGWLWKFGDGQTSTLQSPSHTYTTVGNDTVTITVTNNNGCVSSATPKVIHISAVPGAKFIYSAIDCATQAITFTDQSTTAEGVITSWLWDYGDGSSTELKTTSAAFTHTFTTAGTYPVKLVASNNKGCSSSSTQNITVNQIPVVNFGLPSVCQTDFYANFTDSTTIADNTSSSFTYLWNFGDKNANATYPNTSTLKNPQHHYSDTGRYVVTLTVTSKYGCAVTAAKALTVNGAIPVASFSAVNQGTLCSNREVFIKNTSSVDFGNITKIKLYFDYAGDTTLSITDNSPYPGKLYRHTYPNFQSPASKTYTLYMKAYSGGSCGADTTKTILLLATPSVTFPAISAICHDAGTIQLAVTPNASAVTATGVFLGTGVNTTGLFDPSVSGVGTFTIKYIYTSTNTCADTVSQTITVNPNPTVSAGPDLIVLEGSSMKFKATASDSVTYSWSPTTYLTRTNVLNPSVTPLQNIKYTLTVTTAKGCSSSSSVKVTVLKTPIIPNTFTPNGDGKNDTWNIQYLDSYPDATVDVYNRNGSKVFSSVGYPKAWDGRYRGEDLPVGVYYYVINPNHGRSTLSGSITIVR